MSLRKISLVVLLYLTTLRQTVPTLIAEVNPVKLRTLLNKTT
jgi:hypothetical protein